MWFEFHRLLEYVQNFTELNSEEDVETLIEQLNKYKLRLQKICSNTGKKAASRNLIVPDKEIDIDGSKVSVDKSICDETLIISDIFDLDEVEALQIVLSGEAQQANFGGLTRGLVAVVCYYDMHRFLAEVLRTIVSWDRFCMADNLRTYIDNNFIQPNVLKHLLDLQQTFNVQSIFALLSQERVNGLGGSKHQQCLRTVIEDIIESSCEAIYSLCDWASDKSKDFVKDLYPVLKAVPPAEKMSHHNLVVWCTLVKLTSCEILGQASIASTVLNDMITEIRNETVWSDQSVCGTVQLACALTIRAMAVHNVDHLNIANISMEDVDRLVDRAVVSNMCFRFIRHGIIASDSFKQCFSHSKIIDYMMKQLITLFPAKLMEIERNSEEELVWLDQLAEKQQQANPSLNYSTFLGCITDVFSVANSPLISPLKKAKYVELSSYYGGRNLIELSRFMERARISCHAIHSVAYLEFLRAVCRTQATASFLFDIFARVPGHNENFIGWEHVTTALKSYERLFREQRQPIAHFGPAVPAAASVPAIPAQELAGLVSWINLAKTVANLDDESAMNFVEERSWCLVDAAVGVVAAPVPLVLKGSLLGLLAAVARSEFAVSKIWNSLEAYRICSFAENGALLGLQQELEERECTERRFDTSLGFAYLIRSLVQHSIPNFAGPYLQYVTKSIVSQMASRAYDDVQQMWELAEVSMDALLWILKKSYTDTRAVSVKEPHVQLLVQLLNDTPVFRALTVVLMEDCDVFLNPPAGGISFRASQRAALIALELLSTAAARYSSLRSAIRSANSDLMIASIQVLFLSPLRPAGDTVLDLVFYYLEQVDELPRHALFAAQILNNMCAIRPNLQSKMVELIRSKMRVMNEKAPVRAIASVLNRQPIYFTVDDIIHQDLEVPTNTWCRGETARLVLEILIDSVSIAPNSPNLCYLLFGFHKNNTGLLFPDESASTGFHAIVDIIEQFNCEDPFSLHFSALLEPSFRLLQRLVSVDCIYATEVLRHLRSSDCIPRLIGSPAITNCLSRYTAEDETSTLFSLSRMIAGSILHLSALQISFILRNGHFEKPAELYHLLFDSSEEGEGDNLLFNIIRKSHINVSADFEFPRLVHFNAQKLQTLFNECCTKTVFGIVLTDVDSIHALLKREIMATKNEDIRYVEKEMTSVLEYCTDLNAQLLQRGSSSALVSGCSSLLNVIAMFSPVPFLSTECQLDVLTDASFLLMEFSGGCPSAPLVNVCDTIHRICKAICVMAKENYTDMTELRSVVAGLFTPLVELIVLPREKPLKAKFSLYDSARQYLRLCYVNEDKATEAPDDWLLSDVVHSVRAQDPLRTAINRFAQELGQSLVTDISDLPANLKLGPLRFLQDLLYEDNCGSKKFAAVFSNSGMPRYLSELLAEIEIDWTLLAQRDAEMEMRHRLFSTLLFTLIRLSATDPGWQALNDLALPEILSQLTAMQNVPKQLFIQTATVSQKGSPSYLFVESLDRVIHLCLALCSKPKWKRLSLKILDVVHSYRDILCQLLRAEIKCSLIEYCSELVFFIWEDDQAARFVFDKDPVLIQLRDFKKKDSKQSPPKESSFVAPNRLLRSMIPA